MTIVDLVEPYDPDGAQLVELSAKERQRVDAKRREFAEEVA